MEFDVCDPNKLFFVKEDDSLYKIKNELARPDSNRRPPPCQRSYLVKESQSRDDEESERDLCASSEEGFGASDRQTDSKNSLFLDRGSE